MATLYAPEGTFEAIVALLVGLVICFAGYRLVMSLAGFAGFLVGFALGFTIGTIVATPIGGLVIGLVVGILFAILAHFALRVLAAVMVGMLVASVALAFGLQLWLAVLLGIVAGLIGLAAHEWVLLVATALVGGIVAGGATMFLLGRMGADFAKDETALLVGALLFTALGIASQWRAMRERG